MRNLVIAAAATVALALSPISQPAAAKSGGSFGGGGFGKFGGSFKSGGFHGKGFGKGFSHGKGFGHGKGHKFGKGFGGFKHARHRFRPIIGWPVAVTAARTRLVRAAPEAPKAPPPPPPVAEWKIYTVDTDGGCTSERVVVSSGIVRIYRC
jgi:hypothetical protein